MEGEEEEEEGLMFYPEPSTKGIQPFKQISHAGSEDKDACREKLELFCGVLICVHRQKGGRRCWLLQCLFVQAI